MAQTYLFDPKKAILCDGFEDLQALKALVNESVVVFSFQQVLPHQVFIHFLSIFSSLTDGSYDVDYPLHSSPEQKNAGDIGFMWIQGHIF